jgi:hypothetical protein
MKFVQLWTSEATGDLVQRQGTLGRPAPVVEAAGNLGALTASFIAKGYEELPDGGWAQVVVQWPMRSLAGTTRDRWLLDRAMEHLEIHLDERGLGYVDGFDRGKRISPDEGSVQNVFINAVDGTLTSTAAMSSLRAVRLDATRASIAHRPNPDALWTVQYARKSNKLPGEFAI